MPLEEEVPAVEITDEEIQALAVAILTRHGIDFTGYEPKSLKRRVIRCLGVFKVGSIHELWVKFLRDQGFVYEFMDEISVGLTAMFRDPVLWKKLKDLLKNEFSAKSSLSVWHAGCSSGEEIYTFGIVLKESGFNKPVTAWATDISKQSIDNARRGEYHVMKLEEYEKNYKNYNAFGSLKNYFTLKGDNIAMNPDLIKHVTFDYHNLITGDFTKKFDIIFCRNVMIYFDNAAKVKLFKKFYQSLNPGGLFIIGFYDSVMHLMDERNFKVLDADSKIFVKVDG
jgi:chemotaxis protein methyltransferase CheR